MGAMQSEGFEAFRAIDIPDDGALEAAAALSRRDDVSSLETDMPLPGWMAGFMPAMVVAIFLTMIDVLLRH